MNQAYVRDHVQAAKVRLAIRWRVDPDDVGDRRARVEAVERLVAESRATEEIVGWVE